jgi:methylthioribose-1-phosphate isomerase
MMHDGSKHRALWLADDGRTIEVIDQTRLPHVFEVRRFHTLEEVEHAIRSMVVRGAPLIGITASYGLALAASADPSDASIGDACDRLLKTRPTAVNLAWAVDRMRERLMQTSEGERGDVAYREAAEIEAEEAATCRAIGEQGLALLRALCARFEFERPLHILTHCNAGWLATGQWGTALAPIYLAHEVGLPIHVWVDETRPRNQGAHLTAWELAEGGVPHTVVPDNVGGHLMQHGLVDCCIVGTDRVTARGDVANKIGTYLKALAAADNDLPFYVALPGSTIDWDIQDGLTGIPIEERSGDEVARVHGVDDDGELRSVRITPRGSRVANYAFDVTPARLITALITERGVCKASRQGLAGLYPELAQETMDPTSIDNFL